MELNQKDNVSFIGVCYSDPDNTWFLLTAESEKEIKEEMAAERVNVDKSFVLKVKLPPTDDVINLEDRIKVVEANQ